MNAKTRAALLGSIKKWRGVADGKVPDLGMDNCPLCQLFIRNQCRDCPVSESTGVWMCKRTPYGEWSIDGPGQGHYAETKRDRKLALAELKFLKSLLPKGNK
jgi:hypothetical protein